MNQNDQEYDIKSIYYKSEPYSSNIFIKTSDKGNAIYTFFSSVKVYLSKKKKNKVIT